MDGKSLPLGLQMLGPALIVLSVMLPWGASPEARGLDLWGLLVLLVGIPALWLPWAAREHPRVVPVLAGLAGIAMVGAFGGWISAWRSIPPEVPDPLLQIGKGPLFTMAGVAMTWATLPPLKGWQRVLAAGGIFGLSLGLAFGVSAGLSTAKQAAAFAEERLPAATRTPWIVIEVHPSSGFATAETEPPFPSVPTPTSPGFSSSEGRAEGEGGSPQGLPTATPEGGAAGAPSPTPVPSTSVPPTIPPTATPPLSPAPTPTAPSSPLLP